MPTSRPTLIVTHAGGGALYGLKKSSCNDRFMNMPNLAAKLLVDPENGVGSLRIGEEHVQIPCHSLEAAGSPKDS